MKKKKKSKMKLKLLINSLIQKFIRYKLKHKIGFFWIETFNQVQLFSIVVIAQKYNLNKIVLISSVTTWLLVITGELLEVYSPKSKEQSNEK